MKPLVFHLPGDEDFADGLIRALGAQRAALQLHRFPTASRWCGWTPTSPAAPS